MSAHRYWRINITEWVYAGGAAGTTGYAYLSYLRFVTPGVVRWPTKLLGGGTGDSPFVPTASSSLDSGHAPYCAFSTASGSVNNQWVSDGSDSAPWLSIDMGSAVEFNAVEIICDYADSENFITAFNVCSSDTGAFAGEEEEVGSFTGLTGWVVTGFTSPPRSFTIGSATNTLTAALVAPMASIMSGPSIANAALAPPVPTVSATGSPIMPITSNAALNAPLPVVRIYGAAGAAVTAPTPYVFGTVVILENGISFGPPVPTLQAFGGLTGGLTAPSPTLAITGTFWGAGKAALAPPTPTLSATGKGGTAGSTGITAPMASLVGYGGAVCSVTIGAATLQATGRAGSVGNATLTAPLFQLTASSTRHNSGSALITAPAGRLVQGAVAYLVAPGATLTAIGSATVAFTYEAYAVNLNHKSAPGAGAVDQVTRFTNYPFDKIVRYRNSYYGVAADGLYLLEGTTDDGAPIEWSVQTAIDDFGSPQKKTLVSTYLAGRFGNAATVDLHVGEKGAETYSYASPRGPDIQNYRQKFGRGVKARYFALGLSGTEEFQLDALDFETLVLSRRI